MLSARLGSSCRIVLVMRIRSLLVIAVMVMPASASAASGGGREQSAASGSGREKSADCGLIRQAFGAASRVRGKGISCEEARALAQRPEDALEQGYYCAASVVFCWTGSPRMPLELERAKTYFASFSVVSVSRHSRILPAARDIATRHVRKQGVHIREGMWVVRCRRSTTDPLGLRGYWCSIGMGGYCTGTMTLYLAPQKRIEALHRVDIACGD